MKRATYLSKAQICIWVYIAAISMFSLSYGQQRGHKTTPAEGGPPVTVPRNYDETIRDMNALLKRDASHNKSLPTYVYETEPKGSCNLIETLTSDDTVLRFAADLTSGDPKSIKVSSNKEITVVVVNQIATEARPADVLSTVAEPPPLPLKGVITAVNGTLIRIVSLKGEKFTYQVPDGATIQESAIVSPGKSPKFLPISAADLKINHFVTIVKSGSSPTVSTFTASQIFDLPLMAASFNDRDTGEMFARALIHAMVLCQSGEANRETTASLTSEKIPGGQHASQAAGVPRAKLDAVHRKLESDALALVLPPMTPPDTALAASAKGTGSAARSESPSLNGMSAKGSAASLAGGKPGKAGNSAAPESPKGYLCRIDTLVDPPPGENTAITQTYLSRAFQSNQDVGKMTKAFVKYLTNRYGIEGESYGVTDRVSGGCWTAGSGTLSEAEAFIAKDVAIEAKNRRSGVPGTMPIETSWVYAGQVDILVEPRHKAGAKTATSNSDKQAAPSCSATTDPAYAKKMEQYAACNRKLISAQNRGLAYQIDCGAPPEPKCGAAPSR